MATSNIKAEQAEFLGLLEVSAFERDKAEMLARKQQKDLMTLVLREFRNPNEVSDIEHCVKVVRKAFPRYYRQFTEVNKLGTKVSKKEFETLVDFLRRKHTANSNALACLKLDHPGVL